MDNATTYPKLLFIADCYKYTHAAMYPSGVEEVYSVLYCRNPRLDLSTLNGHIVAFGMRQAIKKLYSLYDEFVNAPKESVQAGLELLYKGFMKLDSSTESYGLLVGKWLDLPKTMPLRFKVLPEGSFIASNTPIITISCDQAQHCWFVNFVETYLNSELWKSCFVATQAALFKRIEYDCAGTYIDESYNFHDFSQRGMNGIADCYASSMGHLLFFSGSDSMMALQNVCENYGGDVSMLGSIPASEHSVMCLGGESGELDSFKRIMRSFPTSVVSIVADTWNLWAIIQALRDDEEAYAMIQERPQPIVLRPDSGDPFAILTGDENASDWRAQRGVIRLVDESFGLDRVKIIYGDAITPARARKIYEWCKSNGYDPTKFLCFGVGSYAYNSGIRDDVGLVSKMTWAKIDGKACNLIKQPITGNEKTSLSGKVALNARYEVVQFLDKELADDRLTTELSLPSLRDLRAFCKQEFLRVVQA